VRLRLTGSEPRAWTSRVARVAPEDDETTRTMIVFAEVAQSPDQPGGLAPGQFVEASVTCSEKSPRWVIPRRSVDRDRMLLVDDGSIVSRGADIEYQVDVRLPEFGVPDREWVVLREPLAPGALVVLNPKRSLADGLVVQPVVVGEAVQAAGDGIGGQSLGESLR